MIEMEDHTNDLSEGRIPFLDYKTYTDRVFFLPSKDGANDVMITGKLDIQQARRATVTQALNQFSNLLNSKTFLINVITLHLSPWMPNTHNDFIRMINSSLTLHNIPASTSGFRIKDLGYYWVTPLTGSLLYIWVMFWCLVVGFPRNLGPTFIKNMSECIFVCDRILGTQPMEVCYILYNLRLLWFVVCLNWWGTIFGNENGT